MGQRQTICAINEISGRTCTNPRIGGNNRYCEVHWEEVFDSIMDTKDIDDRIRYINFLKGYNTCGKNVSKERIDELNKDINCLKDIRYSVPCNMYLSYDERLKLHASMPKRSQAIKEQKLREEQYKLRQEQYKLDEEKRCQDLFNEVKNNLTSCLESMDRNDDSFWNSITKSYEGMYTKEDKKILYMKLRYGSEYGTTRHLDRPLLAKDPETFSYERCIICKNYSTCTLPCKHRSHRECVEWLNRENPRCPVCAQLVKWKL